jgi:hypothetical protein
MKTCFIGGGLLGRSGVEARARLVEELACRGMSATAANKVAAQAAAVTIRVVVRAGLAIRISGAGS